MVALRCRWWAFSSGRDLPARRVQICQLAMFEHEGEPRFGPAASLTNGFIAT